MLYATNHPHDMVIVITRSFIFFTTAGQPAHDCRRTGLPDQAYRPYRLLTVLAGRIAYKTIILQTIWIRKGIHMSNFDNLAAKDAATDEL
jgi:hypothetical protein